MEWKRIKAADVHELKCTATQALLMLWNSGHFSMREKVKSAAHSV